MSGRGRGRRIYEPGVIAVGGGSDEGVDGGGAEEVDGCRGCSAREGGPREPLRDPGGVSSGGSLSGRCPLVSGVRPKGCRFGGGLAGGGLALEARGELLFGQRGSLGSEVRLCCS